MSTRKQLKALVEARRGVIVPGAFNALSARVIEDLGYEDPGTKMLRGVRTRVFWTEGGTPKSYELATTFYNY